MTTRTGGSRINFESYRESTIRYVDPIVKTFT